MSKVVVLGSNFGGLVAALSIRHELKDEVDVTVISPSDRFVFNPSLIWLPFGKRDVEDLSFRVAPTFEEHGVNFVNTAASSINADANSVTAGGSEYSYDYLVVATGYKNHYGVVEGLGPNGNASTITSLEDAVHAGEAWSKYLADPGDVVIGATQGASCFGAAYEFLFNASYHLNKNHLKEKVKLTYVTSEPFLGHFGIGGLPHGQQLLEAFLKHENINYVVDASVDHIDSDSVKLASGETLPFKYSMFIPPFLGQDVVVESGLADPKGYIPVRPTYQSLSHDNLMPFGDKRDSRADKRDQAGDQRDSLADQRDSLADKRDQAGDQRDSLADKRDSLADKREASAAIEPVEDETVRSALGRLDAARDRKRASLDRLNGTEERIMAERDRDAAQLDP